MYDDFRADTTAVYEEVLRFVGVEPDGRERFGTKTALHRYRYRWLQQLFFKPPGPVLGVVQRRDVHKRRWFEWLKSLRGRLVIYNSRAGRNARLSKEMERVLRNTFESDTPLLGEILGCDLSHWYEESDAAS